MLLVSSLSSSYTDHRPDNHLDELHAHLSEFKREAAARGDPLNVLHGRFSCPKDKVHDGRAACRRAEEAVVPGALPSCEGRDSGDVPDSFFLGFELRWHGGGGFDGVYMDETTGAYASADPCLRGVHATLKRAAMMGDFAAEIGQLPGSNGGTPARRVRYYPSDSGLRKLYGCEYSDLGYNCTEESVPTDTCPDGAPPLLVHSAFLALQWPSVSCVRLIPNLYQLQGNGGSGCVSNCHASDWGEKMSYAGFTAHKAYAAAANMSWFERTPQLLYIGRYVDVSAMAQRAFLHSLRWRNHDEEQKGTESWLSMPDFLNYTDAVSYRFLLDIGGSSGTTWDALQWKLASGALVFKAKNAEGAADLWHRQLKHGQQLLEVEADFSDLHKQVNWALANPVEAEKIAQAGQRAALKNEDRSVHVAALAGVLRAFAAQMGSAPQSRSDDDDTSPRPSPLS